MIAWLIPLVIRAGVPSRLAKFAAWLAATAVIVGLSVVAIVMFRSWVEHGKEEAARIDQQDVTIEAANRVINATSAATANQMERDDAFDNAQQELSHESDTKSDASAVGPGVSGVLERMREQQAAGRRGARAAQ